MYSAKASQLVSVAARGTTKRGSISGLGLIRISISINTMVIVILFGD